MNVNRSWLFVPGDSEKKLAKGLESDADALILDLEDAVAPVRKDAARGLVAEFIKAYAVASDGPDLWVRINPLADPQAMADIAAAVRPGLAGIVLPKAEGVADIRRLAACLDLAESQSGLEQGSMGIFPVATETPRAVLLLPEFAQGVSSRLRALTWGAEDIATAIGATDNKDEAGIWFESFRVARALALFAAHAAGAQAVETLHVDIRAEEELLWSSRRARAEGFTGRIAIHPAQVPTINRAFSTSEQEIEQARKIVALFEGQPCLGAIAVDGKMLDRPHLIQARRILASARDQTPRVR